MQDKQDPLPAVNEEKLEEFMEKHPKDLTLYTVHAVTGWNSNNEKEFHSWTLLKHTDEDGEEELGQWENSKRKDDKTNAKELVKNEARKLARENTPAVIKIENREFETHRVEVSE